MSQHRQLKRELRKTMLDVAENLSRNDVRKIEFAQHLVDTRWSTTASSDAQQRDGMAVLEELQRRRVWNVDLRQRVCELTDLHELLTDIGRPDLIGKLVCLENFLHGAWSHNGSLPRAQSPTSLPAVVVRSPDAEAAYGDLETDSAVHCTLSGRGSLRVTTRTSSHRSSSLTDSYFSSPKSQRSPHFTSRRRHQSDSTTWTPTTALTPPLAPKADGRCNGHLYKTYKHSCGFTGAFEALLSLLRRKHNK